MSNHDELIARLLNFATEEDTDGNARSHKPRRNSTEHKQRAKDFREAATALQSQQPAPVNLGPVRELAKRWQDMRYIAATGGKLELAGGYEACTKNLIAALSQCEAQQVGQAGVVDEAMVERAFKAFCNYPLKMGREDEKQLIRAALQAALNGRET